mgnify:CR=1 FL=1
MDRSKHRNRCDVRRQYDEQMLSQAIRSCVEGGTTCDALPLSSPTPWNHIQQSWQPRTGMLLRLRLQPETARYPTPIFICDNMGGCSRRVDVKATPTNPRKRIRSRILRNVLRTHQWDRLVLTPLILTQPEEVVPTAAASEQNGLEGGWEGVEAMDMVR